MKTNTPSFYCRLFSDRRPGYPEDVLRELASRLKDTAANRDGRKRTPLSVPSAYVYFAQFINHDLTSPPPSLEESASLEPEETTNMRTARLDLEPLYGDGAAYLGKKLELGVTKAGGGLRSSDNDLPRDGAGKARIGDARNDTSLFIAQLHVLMIKFHNRILQDLEAGRIESAGPDSGDSFEQARRLVTWHYQWIVRYDFLPHLVSPAVLDDILMTWPRLYRPKMGAAALPVEFTQSAFQYGHSAVQNKYNVNPHGPPITFLQSALLTGFGNLSLSELEKNTSLPEMYVVDAGRMFGWAPPGVSNTAEEIDTLIAEGIYDLPAKIVIVVMGFDSGRAGHGNFNLPETTFVRGSAIGIPSGQEACRLAGVPALGRDQLAHNDKMYNFLRRHGLLDSTPLFYYVLREAEVAGRATPGGRPCKRLGPLGSRIVAEVLLGILNADPDSFVRGGWQPPEITLAQSQSTIRVDSLKKLALYACGLAQ